MNVWTGGGKKELHRGGREKNLAGRCPTNTCLLFLWIWVIIPLNFAMNKTLCCTAGEEPSHRERRGFRCTLDIMSVLSHWGVEKQKKNKHFICLMLHFYATFVTSRHNALGKKNKNKKKTWVARGVRSRLLPRRDGLGRFLRAACGAQDPEHVGEGAAIGGLGDEDGAAHEED